jgi:hypothetical protein
MRIAPLPSPLRRRHLALVTRAELAIRCPGALSAVTADRTLSMIL